MRISQIEETAREEEQVMEAEQSDAVPVDDEQINDSTQAFITQLTEVLTMIGQEKVSLKKSGAPGKPSEEIMHAVKELIETFPLNKAAKAAGVDKKEAMLAMLEWIDTAQTLAEESNHSADDAHRSAEETAEQHSDDTHSFIDYLPQASKTLSRISALGTGKDLDRYAIRQRKVRCISRGYRYDKADELKVWQRTTESVMKVKREQLISEGMSAPEADALLERIRNEFWEVFMDEPEAKDLEIGKIYTLVDILPDIYSRSGDYIGVGLVFLKEIHSSYEPGGYKESWCEKSGPDGGFHSHLFEELEEVSLEDRVQHYNAFMEWMAGDEEPEAIVEG